MANERLAFGYTDGETVKLEAKRQGDGFRLDFGDGTFKAAGWTTRQQTMAEDVTTPGLYELDVDPATWTDGPYLLIVTEAGLTPPIAIIPVDVENGQFSFAPGVARAVWHRDITAIDEDALLDETGATANRAATALLNLWRRLLGKVVVDTAANTLTIYKKDDVTVLATLPFTSEGTTQTTGPAA